MSDHWWDDVAPVEAEVRCGAGRHVLRWDAGRLHTPAHADPEGEAVLAALGGDEPECLRLERAWRAHAGDSRLLVLGSRHPGDEIHLDLDEVRELRGVPSLRPGRPAAPPSVSAVTLGAVRPTAPGPPARGRPARISRPFILSTSAGPASAATLRPPWLDDAQWHAHVELLSLLALDARLQRRLQAHVAADLLNRPDRSARAALEAATVGRLRPILERWHWAGSGRQPGAAVGETPGVDANLNVTVKLDWLVRVWCRYLSLVDGFLIVDVHRSVPGRAEVTGVPPTPRAPLVRLTVAGPAPWRVVDRD